MRPHRTLNAVCKRCGQTFYAPGSQRFCSPECHRAYFDAPERMVTRFWKRVDRKGPDDCWEWLGRRDSHGYGTLYVGKRSSGWSRFIKAHRFSHELACGPLADGLVVCHRCDNPGCVNPAHLFAGTQGDNMADKVSKGRNRNGVQRGEENAISKLTEAQVIAIRASFAGGTTQADLAREYGVTLSAIYRVVRRKNWRHI